MSVPDDALRRVLQELQTQAITSTRAIGSTRSLITTREREKKLLQLTRNEISSLDEAGKGEAVYRGVGKMFVQEPLKDMLSKMDKREKDLNDDVASLGKKLTYLEKEAAQAQASLKELFEHQKRQ